MLGSDFAKHGTTTKRKAESEVEVKPLKKAKKVVDLVSSDDEGESDMPSRRVRDITELGSDAE
jgi:hypothetical protein